MVRTWMATSKPASAAASVRARPILREPPVMRAAPREVSAKAILVETAEFEVVQSADHDEEDEDGQDRGHEESSGFVPRALERAGLVRKGRAAQVGPGRRAIARFDQPFGEPISA